MKTAFALLMGLSMSTPCLAEIVTYRASGELSYGYGELLDNNVISIGDSFELLISWETTTPGVFSSDNHFAMYEAIVSAQLTVGNQMPLIYQADQNTWPHISQISVTDYNLSGDQYEFTVWYAGIPSRPTIFQDYSLTAVTLNFFDQFSDVIQGLELPTSLDPALFTDTRIQLQYDNSSSPESYFNGRISAMTLVPLPGATWLLGSGILVLGAAIRRDTHRDSVS